MAPIHYTEGDAWREGGWSPGGVEKPLAVLESEGPTRMGERFPKLLHQLPKQCPGWL
jgi:hypothetical protein